PGPAAVSGHASHALAGCRSAGAVCRVLGPGAGRAGRAVLVLPVAQRTTLDRDREAAGTHLAHFPGRLPPDWRAQSFDGHGAVPVAACGDLAVRHGVWLHGGYPRRVILSHGATVCAGGADGSHLARQRTVDPGCCPGDCLVCACVEISTNPRPKRGMT